MLRNRGSRFDTGWLVTFSFFFILVEKNLLRNFLSVAKMASLVYERENCFAGTHLYTWVERGTVRVKCLAQEHNTMSPARARTRSARSGVERTNHKATAPPPIAHWYILLYLLFYGNVPSLFQMVIQKRGHVDQPSDTVPVMNFIVSLIH